MDLVRSPAPAHPGGYASHEAPKIGGSWNRVMDAPWPMGGGVSGFPGRRGLLACNKGVVLALGEWDGSGLRVVSVLDVGTPVSTTRTPPAPAPSPNPTPRA